MEAMTPGIMPRSAATSLCTSAIDCDCPSSARSSAARRCSSSSTAPGARREFLQRCACRMPIYAAEAAVVVSSLQPGPSCSEWDRAVVRTAARGLTSVDPVLWRPTLSPRFMRVATHPFLANRDGHYCGGTSHHPLSAGSQESTGRRNFRRRGQCSGGRARTSNIRLQRPTFCRLNYPDRARRAQG